MQPHTQIDNDVRATDGVLGAISSEEEVMEDASEDQTIQQLQAPEPPQEQPVELCRTQHTDASSALGQRAFCFPSAVTPRCMCLESDVRRAQELISSHAPEWTLVEFKEGSVEPSREAALPHWQLDLGATTVRIQGNDHRLQPFCEAQLFTTWRANTEDIVGGVSLQPGEVCGNTVEILPGGAAWNLYGALPLSSGRHAFEFVAYDGLQSTEVLSCGLVSMPFDPTDQQAGELEPIEQMGEQIREGDRVVRGTSKIKKVSARSPATLLIRLARTKPVITSGSLMPCHVSLHLYHVYRS